ncbi:hypothetical protein BOW51_10265 [Solemya velesiana gill symbiont]|uniref:Uncharacterized protein n=1 Tax=Solemya velesiana gill symbiont TaxID=1918948 RepID=A0A1T2KSW0_9GAMM|nr:hypothetical protein BOW51_10265 [Solemya velesiana gill symbiont]
MRIPGILTSRQSLYITLGIIISTVALIMSSHATYTYMATKDKIIAEMKHTSKLSIVSLEKTLSA